MVTIGTKLLYDNKIFEVTEMGTWGIKAVASDDSTLVRSNTEMNIDINEGKIQVMRPTMKYTLEELKNKVLRGDYEEGMFTSKNEDGEEVIVTMAEDYLKITTFQHNNWIRVNAYEYNKEEGWIKSEAYEGKWN